MMSTIFSAALNMGCLLFCYQIFICEFEYAEFFLNVLKFSVAGVAVYFSGLSFYGVIGYLPLGFWGLLAGLIFAAVLSGLVFVLAAQVLRVTEIQNLLRRVLKR